MTGRRGRRPSCTDEQLQAVLELYNAGIPVREISVRLTEAGIPTPGGCAVWHHSYICHLLNRRWVIEQYGRVHRRRVLGSCRMR